MSNKGYKPVNELEIILEKAGVAPSERPLFYKQLLQSKLYALGNMSKFENGEEAVSFMTGDFEGEQRIYAYTSKEALQHVLTANSLNPVSFVEIPTHTLFKMVSSLNPPTGLMLNSSLDLGKYFTSSEINGLLKGSLSEFETTTLPAGTQEILRQPNEEPVAMLSELKKYLQKQPRLKDIYFSERFCNGTTSYLLCLDANEDLEVETLKFVLDEIYITTEPYMKGIPIDFMVENDDYRKLVKEQTLISLANYQIYS